jgi:hypothetical protein
MSFFNNMLVGPLYCLTTEIDETGKENLEDAEILEIWGVFADGTLIYKNTEQSPWSLEFLRIGSEPTLYFSQDNAEQALEQARKKQ